MLLLLAMLAKALKTIFAISLLCFSSYLAALFIIEILLLSFKIPYYGEILSDLCANTSPPNMLSFMFVWSIIGIIMLVSIYSLTFVLMVTFWFLLKKLFNFDFLS